MSDLLSQFPARIKQSSQADAPSYYLTPDLFAIHGALPEACKDRVVAVIEEGEIMVCAGMPEGLPDAVKITPVYLLEHGPIPAVPTGLIFVRLVENHPIAERRHEIAAAGYRIENVPAYAPHTAWVTDRQDDIARSLGQMERLVGLPGVAHVEPQMLMPKSKRVRREV